MENRDLSFKRQEALSAYPFKALSASRLFLPLSECFSLATFQHPLGRACRVGLPGWCVTVQTVPIVPVLILGPLGAAAARTVAGTPSFEPRTQGPLQLLPLGYSFPVLDRHKLKTKWRILSL